MMTLSDIRSAFLQYFHGLEEGRSHQILPSSSLVPKNDPTLLFTNAGMVQFKDIFTGKETPTHPRAVTSQKCVRAGGKHNDLENVGYTARHHTFFEMLGNFSFGDYFKADAIELAWRFVTRELSISPEKLWVTVFAEDEEAALLWRKIANLPSERILPIATSDNFWSMGDRGPCGPCSEIFYDHGAHIPGGLPGTPDQDGDRFIEIWNLVFMQFDQQMDEKGQIQRVPLPKPSIDTGMGLERIAAVLQGVHNNYEIDLFQKLIQASTELFGVSAAGDHKASHRVIADHLRACSFLIADGVTPSNEGRGYVLRRIMRRAMRHSHQLGARSPLLWKLVPTLVDLMGAAYPELGRAAFAIGETLQQEEGRFQETLGRGLSLLSEEVSRLSTPLLPGKVAFKLYDTYGFPIDLTQDILKSQNIQVDMAGFEAAMAERKAEARAAWAGSGEAVVEEVWFDLRDRLGPTEFLGYTTCQTEAKVLALMGEKGQTKKTVSPGDQVQVIVNQTPFYGASGGQEGDTGTFSTAAGALLQVLDTQKKADSLIVHLCQVMVGELSVGETACLQVHEERRHQLRAHHSATHLLHQILREKLGPHVTQKGSSVSPSGLRFDFSHPKPLPDALLRDIEFILNSRIRANFPVQTVLKNPEQAMAEGAVGLFGEKYPEEVRVVSMGDETFQASSELCGGTHVSRTGDIGYFKILHESGVAAGIRRIEAVTGAASEAFVNDLLEKAQEAAAALKVSLSDLGPKVQSLLKDKKKLESQLLQSRTQNTFQGGRPDQKIKDVIFRVVELKGVPSKDLRGIMDTHKAQLPQSAMILILSQEEDKISFVMGLTGDLPSSLNAATLVQNSVSLLGGKGGGGRADFAQGGAPQGGDIHQMIRYIEDILHQR